MDKKKKIKIKQTDRPVQLVSLRDKQGLTGWKMRRQNLWSSNTTVCWFFCWMRGIWPCYQTHCAMKVMCMENETFFFGWNKKFFSHFLLHFITLKWNKHDDMARVFFFLAINIEKKKMKKDDHDHHHQSNDNRDQYSSNSAKFPVIE